MKHWDDDERAEHDLVVEMTWRENGNAARTDAFLDALHDAEQAHRQWAVDLLNACLRDGAWKYLKDSHRAMNPHKVDFGGQTRSVSRLAGVTRKSGERYINDYLPMADMTWDELAAKEEEHKRTEHAARLNRWAVTRLLSLRDLAPDTATPREAARHLGLDLDDFLAASA